MGIELTRREEEMLLQALPMDGEMLFQGLDAWESLHSFLNLPLQLFPLRSAEHEKMHSLL